MSPNSVPYTTVIVALRYDLAAPSPGKALAQAVITARGDAVQILCHCRHAARFSLWMPVLRLKRLTPGLPRGRLWGTIWLHTWRFARDGRLLNSAAGQPVKVPAGRYRMTVRVRVGAQSFTLQQDFSLGSRDHRPPPSPGHATPALIFGLPHTRVWNGVAAIVRDQAAPINASARGALWLILVLMLSTMLILPYLSRRRPLPVGEGVDGHGLAYRLLHPEIFHVPLRRSCPHCPSTDYPATVPVCTNAGHPADRSHDLPPLHALLDHRATRVWGLRTLVGALVLSMLGGLPAWVVYAAFATTLVWFILHTLFCRPIGLMLLVLFYALVVSLVGLWTYAPPHAWLAWLTAPVRWFPTTLALGSLHVPLTTGLAPRGTLLLDGVVLAVGLVSAVITWRLTTMAMGVMVTSLALFCLSAAQGLAHLAYLALAVLIASCGWLLSAYLTQAILTSRRGIDWTRQLIRPPRFPRVRTPNHRERGARGPGRGVARGLAYMVADLAAAITKIAHAITIAVVEISNLAIGVLERLLAVPIGIVNIAYLIVSEIIIFVGRAMVGFARIGLTTLLPSYKLATAGNRALLIAPLLLAVDAALLVSATVASTRYLSAGDPRVLWTLLWSLLGAGILTIAVAAIYVGLDAVLGVLVMVPEYISSVLLACWFTVDADVARRWALHLPSHVGVITVSLNIVIIGAILVIYVSPFFTKRGTMSNA